MSSTKAWKLDYLDDMKLKKMGNLNEKYANLFGDIFVILNCLLCYITGRKLK